MHLRSGKGVFYVEVGRNDIVNIAALYSFPNTSHSGPFFMENILVPTGTKIPTANQVVEVFDAQTGNALLWGIYA